jgi:hypothetical protein
MPLVTEGGEPIEEPLSPAHGRARKIDPRYTEGDLVKVAGGRNQTEAEFIQGLLLEEGVPSVLRRSPGFDVPDFLAAGPRDILVAASGVDVARQVLLQSDLGAKLAQGRPVAPVKLAVVLIGTALVLAIVLLIVV